MKNKGFTLIELLAVIVILAIIALIATPIILNIIKDTKEESKIISAENYLSAIEQAIVRKNLNGEFKPTNCTMSKNSGICEGKFGAVYCDGKTVCEVALLEINVDGQLPTEAAIVFENNLITDETTITIGDSILVRENNKFKIEKKEVNQLAKKNVKASTEETKTTGIVPTLDENDNIKSGSEFKIKVSDNIKDEKGKIAEYTFFVLSSDGDYVNLIAEQNITLDGEYTKEPQDNDNWYANADTILSDNRYGPKTAYDYLTTATNNWTNIPIIENFDYDDEGYKKDSSYGYQSIITEKDNQTGKYITTITPYSSDYGAPVIYENMRARLPKYNEIKSSEIGCTSNKNSCPLWMVNYLTTGGNYSVENGKVNSIGYNEGYWLLASYSGSKTYARVVYFTGCWWDQGTKGVGFGIRPVITVLKSDLLRVMN